MVAPGEKETFRNMAQDGADISSPYAMPSGGWGIRGWLSAIWTSFKSAIDLISGAVNVVDYSHHEMHSGSHYFIKTFLVDTGGSGSTSYFAFTTPSNGARVHAKALIAPDVDTEINIYEGSVVTGGTPIDGVNNDRDSSNVAGLVAVTAPAHTTPGTAIWSARTGGGRNPVGVSPGFSYEIIAATDTVYVFEIIKRTTADLVVDVDFWWYEHTPKTA